MKNVDSLLRLPRTVHLVRGRLTKTKIQACFGDVRERLDATTKHSEVATKDGNSGVRWSLWIGQFDTAVSWLAEPKLVERNYAYVLVMEHKDLVGWSAALAGDVGPLLKLQEMSYERLIGLHSDEKTEYESVTARHIRGSGSGVARSTQSGRHLESTLSRTGSHRSIPSRVQLRNADQVWTVSPGSGRVAANGVRENLEGLLKWFAGTCDDIRNAGSGSSFIRTFAFPISLKDLPAGVNPSSVQLDPTELDELIDAGAELLQSAVAVPSGKVDELRLVAKELFLIDPVRSKQEIEDETWWLLSSSGRVGKITQRETKISLVLEPFRDIRVKKPDKSVVTLQSVFSGGDQPYRVVYSDPSYAYTAGQLFHDHRLLGLRSAIVALLDSSLPSHITIEKGTPVTNFDPDTIFGHVVAQLSTDPFLVCDDIGTEWADFIGVDPASSTVTFYHCKGGDVDVGVSDLHTVVSQALKNLAFLTASAEEVNARVPRWAGTWNGTTIACLQRGLSPNAFAEAFKAAINSPSARSRVVIVASGLSKGPVSQALTNLNATTSGKAHDEALHILWLLSSFIDQCRAVGASPEIICRP